MGGGKVPLRLFPRVSPVLYFKLPDASLVFNLIQFNQLYLNMVMAQQAGFQTYRAVFCGKIGHKTE